MQLTDGLGDPVGLVLEPEPVGVVAEEEPDDEGLLVGDAPLPIVDRVVHNDEEGTG